MWYSVIIMCTRPELNLMQNSSNLKQEYYEIAKINSKYKGENVSIILKQFKLSEMILIKNMAFEWVTLKAPP